MSYNITAVRDATATDGSLYPVLSDETSPYVAAAEPDDGTFYPYRATGMRISEYRTDRWIEIGKLENVILEAYLTDARLIVACRTYNKAGGYRGFNVSGLVVAGVANAVSHANAARKRRGTALVGHIRYPWLTQVGATVSTRRGTMTALQLRITERMTGINRALSLEISFDRGTDTPGLAQAIAQRAAHFHLARTVAPHHPHYDAYRTLTTTAPLTPEPGNYAFYTLPHFYYAQPDTAYHARLGVIT